MLDRVTMNGVRPLDSLEPYFSPQCIAETSAFTVERLRRDPPTVVSIDNVADYYWQGTAQSTWRLARDFPSLAPAWQHAWFEYRAPAYCLSERGREPWDTTISGTHIAVEVASFEPENLFAHLGERIRPWFETVRDESRWAQMALLYIEFGKGLINLVAVTAWTLDHEGRAVSKAGTYPFFMAFGEPAMASQEANERLRFLADYSWSFIYPALLAMSFLNCRNVEIINNQPHEKLVKATLKRHQIRPVSFKTLRIDPVKKILENQGQASQHGIQKALHICRGHFKDFRQSEKGLFGRSKGLYWWGMHLRGSLAHGAAHKEYEMPAPEAGKN
jgi:hypothetical protein